MAKDPPIGFVKIPGIKGGSVRKNFEDQIPIFGYEHKMLRRGDAVMLADLPGTVRVSHPLSFDDNIQPGGHAPFVIHKALDRATVLLIQALDTNKLFEKSPIEISVLQSVKGQELVTLMIKLTNAIVRSIQYSERSGEETQERVAFVYSAIEWTYDGLDEGGQSTGAVSTSTSLEAK